MPERGLIQAEVEEFWIQDRANLIECGEYKRLLSEFYADRDKRIQEPVE